LRLNFEVGKKATAEGGGALVESQEILSKANSRGLTEDEVRACFLKTDGLPVDVTFENIEIVGDVFMAKSQLNAFRRAFYATLQGVATKVDRECLTVRPLPKLRAMGANEKLAVIADNFDGVSGLDVAIYKPFDFSAELPESFINGQFEKFIYYPAFADSRDIERIETLVKSGNYGLYAENYGGLYAAKRLGVKAFVGTGLNVTNHIAADSLLQDETVAYYAVSKELEKENVSALSSNKAFALSSGGLKLMDLIYCPFEKSCKTCDKRSRYALTDENGREFPVRRYISANGECRFEVYNCAALIGDGKGMGNLCDLTLATDKNKSLSLLGNTLEEKNYYEKYTFGHTKNNPLL
ncbi:MAG: DUF3656 domain-containing protein, partial [Clostridia bacterium]|nr:DUF3656 domain-containing protein [Clostridia bacterium]